MSIHPSLRSSGALGRTRNVFKRVERLQILKDSAIWDESKSVFGLPKVRTRFKTASSKKKEEEEKKKEAGDSQEAADADAKN